MVKKLCFFLFLVLTLGCYEPIEDCLDVDAVNYNVEADDACGGCCNLPYIDIQFSFLYQGESFSSTDTIVNSVNEKFLISDFHFFLQDITFVTDGEAEIRFEDSLRIFDDEDNLVWILDDFRLFDRANFSSEMDGIRYTGNIESVKFKMGLPDLAIDYDIDSLELNSGLPTSIPDDAYSEASGFVLFQMELVATDSGEILSFETNDVPTDEIQVRIQDLVIERAENNEVNLTLEFAKLIDGISTTNSTVMNQELLLQNFLSSLGQK